MFSRLTDKYIRRDAIVYLLTVGLLAATGVILLLIRPMNHDVAWYLYGASRMTAGAKLYVDIIDINAPLIFYITLVPVWVSHLFGWSEVISFQIYIAGLVILSFVLCARLTKQVFSLTDESLRQFFLALLMFLFFIYVRSDTGQREHLMFLLVMPYLVASIVRAQGEAIDRKLALLLGVLAGLGIALKPHFVLLWLSVEFYLIFKGSIRTSWRRPEIAAILAVFVVYGISLLPFLPDYLKIARITVQVYAAYNTGRLALLLNPTTMMWAASAAAFWLVRLNPKVKEAKQLLLIASTTFLIIAVAQRKGWFYHFYPAQATLILLLGLLAPQVVEKLVSLVRLTSLSARFLSAGFVSIALTWCVLIVTVWHFTVALRRPFPPLLSELIYIVRQHAERKPILLLSTSLDPSFPLVNYTGSRWGSRFNCLWLLPGLYKNASTPKSEFRYHRREEMNETERYVFDATISDVLNDPPALLIVDVNPHKLAFGDIKFDFIDYFSQDVRFTNLLTQYEHLTDVEHYVIYKRKVDALQSQIRPVTLLTKDAEARVKPFSLSDSNLVFRNAVKE